MEMKMKIYFDTFFFFSLLAMSVTQKEFCPFLNDAQPCTPCLTNEDCANAGADQTKCCYTSSCCLSSDDECNTDTLALDCTPCTSNTSCGENAFCCDKIMNGCCMKPTTLPMPRDRNDYCINAQDEATLTVKKNTQNLVCTPAKSCSMLDSAVTEPTTTIDPRINSSVTTPTTTATPSSVTTPTTVTPRPAVTTPTTVTTPPTAATRPTTTISTANPRCSNVPSSFPSNNCLGCTSSSSCASGGVCCPVPRLGKNCCIYSGR